MTASALPLAEDTPAQVGAEDRRYWTERWDDEPDTEPEAA